MYSVQPVYCAVLALLFCSVLLGCCTVLCDAVPYGVVCGAVTTVLCCGVLMCCVTAVLLCCVTADVVVTIATDGESSDGDIAAAMRPLQALPVWVVIRLCTDDERVVNYWNTIDAQVSTNKYN
mgnify:FL=1